MKQLSIRRNENLATIWCEGGKVQDKRTLMIYSEVQIKVYDWQTDEQILSNYDPI